MSDGPEWFAPKRYGFGAGLPIAWQGWAVLAAYVALLGAATLLLPRSPVAFGSVAIILTLSLIVVAARTTRGGWRWRWGEKE